MGTAHLSILITVGYYVFALDPDEDPHVAANGGTTAWGGNPVDRYFVGILRKGFIKSSLRRIAQAEVAQTLEKAFNRVSRLPILLSSIATSSFVLTVPVLPATLRYSADHGHRDPSCGLLFPWFRPVGISLANGRLPGLVRQPDTPF